MAEDLVEPLHERIAQLSTSAGFAGKIVLIGEPQMAIGDCRVEWPDGGAERDMAALVNDVGEAVKRYLGLQAETAAALPEAAEPPSGDASASAPPEPASDGDAAAPTPASAPPAGDADPDDPLATDALPTVAGHSDALPPSADQADTATEADA